jgi:hypothetical protein
MRTRRDRRGFSLLVVMLVMALLAVIGVIVLSLVQADVEILGIERVSNEARYGAEGAGMEVLNDDDLTKMLPGYAAEDLMSPYTKSAGSAFDRESTMGLSEIHYDAEVYLVRDTPVHESSLTVTRAFLYQIELEARVNGGAASDEVHAEIYKVFTMPAGTVLPDKHAR